VDVLETLVVLVISGAALDPLAVMVTVTGRKTVVVLQADALVKKSKYSTSAQSEPKTSRNAIMQIMRVRML
jgi:hypothetical protein